VNYFQPSFKLREKVRQGEKARRTYDQPATPCARLLVHPAVDDKIKEILRSQRAQLDPLHLLHRLREGQAALASLVSPDRLAEGPGRKTLDQFLSQLPELWRSGEVRPTHCRYSAKPRRWRTRKDPFEAVWLTVLAWLERDPDATAKELFDRLQEKHPGVFSHGQLRTLQRRVKQWRQIMAKKLVYACMDGTEAPRIEGQCLGGATQDKGGLFQPRYLHVSAGSLIQGRSRTHLSIPTCCSIESQANTEDVEELKT
jgi:acyl transferase domain-containing protein